MLRLCSFSYLVVLLSHVCAEMKLKLLVDCWYCCSCGMLLFQLQIFLFLLKSGALGITHEFLVEFRRGMWLIVILFSLLSFLLTINSPAPEFHSLRLLLSTILFAMVDIYWWTSFLNLNMLLAWVYLQFVRVSRNMSAYITSCALIHCSFCYGLITWRLFFLISLWYSWVWIIHHLFC